MLAATAAELGESGFPSAASSPPFSAACRPANVPQRFCIRTMTSGPAAPQAMRSGGAVEQLWVQFQQQVFRAYLPPKQSLQISSLKEGIVSMLKPPNHWFRGALPEVSFRVSVPRCAVCRKGTAG